MSRDGYTSHELQALGFDPHADGVAVKRQLQAQQAREADPLHGRGVSPEQMKAMGYRSAPASSRRADRERAEAHASGLSDTSERLIYGETFREKKRQIHEPGAQINRERLSDNDRRLIGLSPLPVTTANNQRLLGITREPDGWLTANTSAAQREELTYGYHSRVGDVIADDDEDPVHY